MIPSRTTEHRVNGATIHRIVFDDHIPLTDTDVIGHGKVAVFRIRRDRARANTPRIPASPINVSISTQVWHLLRSQAGGDLLGPDPAFWGCGLLVESWSDVTWREHSTGEDIVRMEFESESPVEPDTEPADAPPRRIFVIRDNGTSNELPLLASRGPDGKILLVNHKSRIPIRVFDRLDGDPKEITVSIPLEKIPGFSVPTPEDVADRWLRTTEFRTVNTAIGEVLRAGIVVSDDDYISTSVTMRSMWPAAAATKEEIADGSWARKCMEYAKEQCLLDLKSYLIEWGYAGWPKGG